MDAKLKELVAGVFQLGEEEVTLEMSRENTPQWSSLAHLLLITDVEKSYGLTLRSDQVVSISSLQELNDIIHGKASAKSVRQAQPAFSALAKDITREEFKGQRCLVIGGSRGLGEVAAKLLSAGGAQVRITYHQSKDEAGRIVDESKAGGGLIDCAPFDVLEDVNLESAQVGGKAPTQLFYFATPFISGTAGVFSQELFRKFSDHYVTGFARAVDALKGSLQGVFYPSSVFVDELPGSLREYAAAKAAGELLCASIRKENPSIHVHSPRLPRMATDQTAGLPAALKLDPAPVILKEIRSLLGACR